MDVTLKMVQADYVYMERLRASCSEEQKRREAGMTIGDNNRR